MSQTEVQLIKDSAVVSADIADQAVTLDKLPHGTSSNNGKFLRANNGADPSFETVTQTTINNQANNRLITATGTTNTLNGEANLTFDGAQLFVQSDGNSDPIVANSTYANKKVVIRETSDANSNGGIVIQKKHSTLHPANYWYGDIRFEGWDGSGYHRAGLIECVAEGTPANDNMPGGLRFSTNPGQASQVERLRITKDGNIGIGTTSPSSILTTEQSAGNINLELHATGSGRGSQVKCHNDHGTAYLGLAGNTSGELLIYQETNAPTIFHTNGQERMRIDASGRLGLGVVPSDFHSNNSAVFQLKDGNSIFSRTGGQFLGIFQNIKYNSSDVTQYIANGLGSAYFQAAGEHKFYTVPSGTANNNATLSERMRIDSSGNVGIGTTSPSTTLSVINDSADQGINVKHSNLTKGVNIGFEKIQTVGTASDISLTIQAKGPSANLRCGIDSYHVFGAQQDSRDFRIFKNKQGWSTLQMDADGGITGPIRRHVRRMNNGQNSVATRNVFRLRRHNWGSGFFEVRMYATYYSGSYLRRFRIMGHGAGGNYYSVLTMDDDFTNGSGADWSVGCQIANASSNAPGDSSTYFCDVQVTIPNYWYGLCELIMSSGYQTDNASAGGAMASNSYTLWS